MELLHINKIEGEDKKSGLAAELLNGANVVMLESQTEWYDDKSYDYATTYLCYYQNRLFTVGTTGYHSFSVDNFGNHEEEYVDSGFVFGRAICDYCIIPDADSLLELIKENSFLKGSVESGC